MSISRMMRAVVLALCRACGPGSFAEGAGSGVWSASLMAEIPLPWNEMSGWGRAQRAPRFSALGANRSPPQAEPQPPPPKSVFARTHFPSEDELGQVFVRRDRFQLVADVIAVDRNGLLRRVGSGKAHVLEQPLEQRIEASGADVLAGVVDVVGHVGQRLHAFLLEFELD